VVRDVIQNFMRVLSNRFKLVVHLGVGTTASLLKPLFATSFFPNNSITYRPSNSPSGSYMSNRSSATVGHPKDITNPASKDIIDAI